MSRLIIKNLPNSVTKEELFSQFSKKGSVTDVQLKYNREGQFRNFAFIGYKSEEEAKAALEFFNNSCIGFNRIQIDTCADLGSTTKPRAWSKYAKGSSAYSKLHPEETEKQVKENAGKMDKSLGRKGKEAVKDPKVKELLEKYKDDPLFVEFMETRLGKRSLWSNDVLGGTGDGPAVNEKTVEELKSRILNSISDEDLAAAKISDLEYLQRKIVKSKSLDVEKTKSEAETNADRIKDKKKEDCDRNERRKFFFVKISNLPYNIKKRDLKDFVKPLKPKSIRIPQHVKSFAFLGFLNEKEAKQAAIKNRSFIKGKRVTVVLYKEDEKPVLSNNNDISEKFRKQEQSLLNEETVADSGRIFARNLSYCVSEDEIQELFSKYGDVSEVTVPVDQLTRKPKGFAIITFLLPESAVRAFTDLDGTIFQGRMLHLLPAKTKATVDELLETEGLDFKRKKSLLLKKMATSAHSWNTLFLGQNAVTDLIAETYHTTKEKVLDDSGKGSVAVRLALGETQLVAETKRFLQENGVQLDAFNRPATQRSKKVILVKNLPARTTASEIRELFEPFGLVGRVILPSTGITGLVEFMDSSEAKRAFLKLAYSKFKSLPLYLEWAPVEALLGTGEVGSDSGTGVKGDTAIRKQDSESNLAQSEKDKVNVEEEEDDDEAEPNSTLFLKNLNFSTTEEEIKEHFKQCGKIANVTVATKPDPNEPGKRLSQGYGFIQFHKQNSVEEALKNLQFSSLDGHKLELKRSHRTLQANVSLRKSVNQAKPTGTKILVRNIPFQASQQEVFELFKVFGQIKTVRLPKKMVGTGSHRGFAFIDFHSKNDAKNAMEALCQSTHLYGRRLVLEWAATDDDDVDVIRKRTAERFVGQESSHKTFKKGVFDIETSEDPRGEQVSD